MSWLLFPDATRTTEHPWRIPDSVTKAPVVIQEAPPFHGILRDWDDVVDLVAIDDKPPRFPWEIPAAVVLIVLGLALLILG